jgi:hypothetical protein
MMRAMRGSAPAGEGVIFASGNWVAIISSGKKRIGNCSGFDRSAIHSQCAPRSLAIPVPAVLPALALFAILVAFQDFANFPLRPA